MTALAIRFLRRRAPAEAVPVTPPTVPAAVKVTLVMSDREETVELRRSADRVTEILNDLEGVWYRPIPARGDDVGEWRQLPCDEVMFVIPPPQPTNPRHRLHRLGRRVHVVVGTHEITGTVHIPPAAEAVGFLSRHGGRFVAVTRPAIRLMAPGEPERVVDVAIVNLRAATSLRTPEALPIRV